MPATSATPRPAAKPHAKSAPQPATPAAATKAAAAPPVALKHLAARLADTHALPKQQAETLMDNVIGLIVSHLKAGNRLRLAGFGILEVKNRPTRSGRNPATGAIQIAASKKIAFWPAKELKAAIRPEAHRHAQVACGPAIGGTTDMWCILLLATCAPEPDHAS